MTSQPLILITGVAGFIGSQLALRLLQTGQPVVGIDNLNEYYDPTLKKARLALLEAYPSFSFQQIDIAHSSALSTLFNQFSFQTVVHLAAQAGVRYSLQKPEVYLHSNLVGFGHILENCRHHTISHLVFASSSSVYGANTLHPFSETHSADHPISLYAATKKSNELMAHSYAALYQLPCTGLRFFTVYGPWGRPDMALFQFTDAILNNQPISVFNQGNLWRDFTYSEDVVSAIVRVMKRPALPEPHWHQNQPDRSFAPYRIYNVGNSQPVKLLDFIEILEKALGKKAQKQFLPTQPGDVHTTFADTTALQEDFGWKAMTALSVGIPLFVNWYKTYYNKAF